MAVTQTFKTIDKYFNVETGKKFRDDKFQWQAVVTLIDNQGNHDVDGIELSDLIGQEVKNKIFINEDELSYVIELLQAVQSEVSKWENSSAK